MPFKHTCVRPLWSIRSGCGSNLKRYWISARLDSCHRGLFIYSAPNCSKIWGVQCYGTVHSITLAHIPDLGLPFVAILSHGDLCDKYKNDESGAV